MTVSVPSLPRSSRVPAFAGKVSAPMSLCRMLLYSNGFRARQGQRGLGVTISEICLKGRARTVIGLVPAETPPLVEKGRTMTIHCASPMRKRGHADRIVSRTAATLVLSGMLLTAVIGTATAATPSAAIKIAPTTWCSTDNCIGGSDPQAPDEGPGDPDRSWGVNPRIGEGQQGLTHCHVRCPH